MDVIMGQQKEKNKHMLLFIFGAIILLTGLVFTISQNKKLIPNFNFDPTPSPINPALDLLESITPTPTAPPVQTFSPVTELKIENLKPGVGAIVASGSAVSVHYIGMLTNGQPFDNSLQRNQPFQFVVGEGKVIKGWEEGLIGMRAGGIRRLHIPAELGYGKEGVPPSIPPNATLIFDIQLLDVK